MMYPKNHRCVSSNWTISWPHLDFHQATLESLVLWETNVLAFTVSAAMPLCLGISPSLLLQLSAHHPVLFLSPSFSVRVCLSPSLQIVADYSGVLVWGHRQPSCSIWTCFLPRKPQPDETTHMHKHTHRNTKNMCACICIACLQGNRTNQPK